MIPQRVQMTRGKPWRAKNPHAVIVDRRTPWGNWFVIGETGVPDATTAVALFRSAILLTHWAEAHAPACENMLLAGLMAKCPGRCRVWPRSASTLLDATSLVGVQLTSRAMRTCC